MRPQTKRELDVIHEVMEQHQDLLQTIQQRKNSVEIAIKYWKNSNFQSVINTFKMMNKDPSVIMDVINHTFARGLKMEVLNYENIHEIMPFITSLIASKYESYVLAGLRATKEILQRFGPEIIQIKSFKMLGGGVDLAREERIRNVDKCVDEF